jgi:hypothetical protein
MPFGRGKGPAERAADPQGAMLSYMKLMDVPLGLLINFHETKLINRVHRLILPGANQ